MRDDHDVIRRFQRRYRLEGEEYHSDDRDPWWTDEKRSAYLLWLTTVKREQIDADFRAGRR